MAYMNVYGLCVKEGGGWAAGGWVVVVLVCGVGMILMAYKIASGTELPITIPLSHNL